MIPSTKTVSFYTLGCRLNQSETAVIRNSFEQKGYKIVHVRSPADIVVINTCTVTESGDSDCRRLVNRISRINPNSQIALVGCQAQVQKERLARLPNVYWVVGNAKKFNLPELLKKVDSSCTPQVIAPPISRNNFKIPVTGIDRDHTRVNLKIQDGCNFFCSFCEIPYARGRARSRKFKDIIKEAREVVAAGHKEIVLTGINIGIYQDGDKKFLDVICDLEQIDGLKRIRISSVEFTTIPMALLDKMRQNPKICRYLHIPLQSGHNKILKLMNRKYKIEEFQDFVNKIYQKVPEVCLGTDVIVGFPGETDQYFHKTVEFLEKLPFCYFHVFSYSNRYLAKSRKFLNSVDSSTIQKRSKILRNLSTHKRQLFSQKFMGTTQSVLFEQKRKGFWAGLTDNYVRVRVTSEENLENQILPVKIETMTAQGLFGKGM